MKFLKKGSAELKRESLIEQRRGCLKEKRFTKRGRIGLKAKTCLYENGSIPKKRNFIKEWIKGKTCIWKEAPVIEENKLDKKKAWIEQPNFASKNEEHNLKNLHTSEEEFLGLCLKKRYNYKRLIKQDGFSVLVEKE